MFAIQASFEENVNNCLENIVKFSSLIKHIHDISGCGGNCEVCYLLLLPGYILLVIQSSIIGKNVGNKLVILSKKI